MINFNLDARVRIADGREGFVLGGAYRGGRCLEIEVMTDDFIRVKCLEEQLRKIKRNGPTEPFGQEKKLLYPIEATNHMKLREAVWHAFWDKCGYSEDLSPHPKYSRDYEAGNIIPLPTVEDIRESAILMPRQLAFTFGRNC